nr:Calx-beta domain-containing protein [Ardenticatena sp.]
MWRTRQIEWRITLFTTIGLLLLIVWLAWYPSLDAIASPTATTRYVDASGTCGGATPCYSTIQAAVDAANDGDTIKVAAGTYTGVQTRLSASTGYTYTQIVFIDSKSLTLEGGYTTSDWNISDPATRPTILDAQGYGRGITILGSGNEHVTLSGFQIVNGDYTNLGNPPGIANAACPTTGGDCAGGLFASLVKVTLRDMLIRNNTASRLRPYSEGGGLLLWEVLDGTTLDAVQVFSNTNIVEGYGGGISINDALGTITITNSQIEYNHSTFDGGGIKYTGDGLLTIRNTRFTGNSAVGRSDSNGGAIAANVSADVILDRVEFRNNVASDDGAALYVRKVGPSDATVRLVNVLAAENRLTADKQPYGSVFNFLGGTIGTYDIHLSHVTIADNRTPGGIRFAQWATSDAIAYTARITNTLVTSATYGFVGAHYTRTLTIRHTNTLFYNVATQTVAENGTPTFIGTGTVTGNPNLDSNQRLQSGSAAIDAGVNSGVTLDIDGGVRPSGAGYDIGADEYAASSPGTLRFSQATYAVDEGNTLQVTVERVNGTSGTVSVQYSTSDGTATAGSDYTAASGTLTFADGETSKTFTLATTQDTVDEPDETLVLRLQNPGGGATLGSPNQAVVTIVDDDTSAAGIIRFSSATYTVTESATTATITVVRTNGSSGTVSVQYSTSDGTATAGNDYVAASGTLTFNDGETSKTFTVQILPDAIDELDETINLTLYNVTGGASLGTPNQATLVIVDASYIYLPVILR